MDSLNVIINQNIDNKLLIKLQSTFTETQQQLFVQSFVMYLNHDQELDFVVDLDNIYEWIGFGKKSDCKKVLTKHFMTDIDYKVIHNKNFAPATTEAVTVKSKGGQNKETILMNIKTFKKLCMKAATKKADEIHDYYLNWNLSYKNT